MDSIKTVRGGEIFTIFRGSQIFGILSIQIGDVWISLSYDRQTFSENRFGEILARVVNCYPRKFQGALSRIAD